mgnify:CR=1 FL=1
MPAVWRDPDRTGLGKAWIVPVPENAAPEQAATVRGWLLRGPWHPLWSAWMIAVVHLRRIDGTREPYLQFPGASHEFLIISLESPPSCPDRDPDPDDVSTWYALEPPDAVVQVSGITDEQAAEIADLIVEKILAGDASPDSDFRAYWERTIPATAEHYNGHVTPVQPQ